MKRPKAASSQQSSADIISGLEQKIGETTKRLERALSDPRFSKPNKRLLLDMSISCSIILLCLYFGFLRPLEKDAVDMHTQQLDPTQIIAIPYNRNRLLVYTVATASFTIWQHGVHIWNEYLSLSIYTLAAMVLSGASVKDNLVHSLCAAVYWVTLAFFLEPPFLSPSTRTSFASCQDRLHSNGRTRLLRSDWLPKAVASIETSSFVFHTTLATTIVFQILTLYDRGWQWQRWPVPTMVGSSFGWIFGNMIVAVKQTLFWRRGE